MKYIIVSGGGMSGIGKGITASSIGVILQFYGYHVTAIKIDPYLNYDAGTMSPLQHGECYVLADGGECDLDLGNYERFLNISLTKDHNITGGKIYSAIQQKERLGEYLGQTVQVVPHWTNEVKSWISRASMMEVIPGQKPEICIIELGGTVGDIENAPFVEALRQFCNEEVACLIHVTYAHVITTHNGESKEIKTKPVQYTVAESRKLGIAPHIICVRCDMELTEECIQKISNFCNIPKTHIIKNFNIENIYGVPLQFQRQNIIKIISEQLKLPKKKPQKLCIEWENFVHNSINNTNKICNVVVIGKYTKFIDSYLSLSHGIKHAAYYLNLTVNISYIAADELTQENYEKMLVPYNAIVIPGGFGDRGISGMLLASSYSRNHNVPLLGICLGMQVQIIDVGRNLLNMDCDSTEFNMNTKNPVITIINDKIINMGGTMKLGLHQTTLSNDNSSLTYRLYKQYSKEPFIYERHRHRYEFNPIYTDIFKQVKLNVIGTSMGAADIIELKNHKYFIGCQFHPEYNTHHNKPHPLFIGLLQAAINK